jgi:hypothetical protein
VSHWSVASVATVKFGAFDELKNDPTIGRAVALRRAEMAMLDPKNPPEFAHPLSGRRSCSLAKVAREGKIDRSEMAIRGISAGGLRRSSLVRQTAGYGASFALPHVPAKVPSLNAERPLSPGGANWSSCPQPDLLWTMNRTVR